MLKEHLTYSDRLEKERNRCTTVLKAEVYKYVTKIVPEVTDPYGALLL